MRWLQIINNMHPQYDDKLFCKIYDQALIYDQILSTNTLPPNE